MPEAVAFAWFPAGDFEAALEQWPDLMDEPITDHGEYCWYIEKKLREFADVGGTRVLVAPLLVEDLVSFASERGEDPGSAETRATFAAVVAQRGRAVAWPPSRNDRCWCGSGQKYKWCCARASHDTERS